jgi:hypothetical protein
MGEHWNTNLAALGQLQSEQRLLFFELLAHNLTVAARGGWSEPGLTVREQVEALKQFNECLHRVTARIRVQRLNSHEWKDEDFVLLLAGTDGQLHPRLKGSVLRAFECSIAVAAA